MRWVWPVMMIALPAAIGQAAEPFPSNFGRSRTAVDRTPAVREPWLDLACLDRLAQLGDAPADGRRFQSPVSGGAWHWFHQSLIGRPGGYGIPGLRDTYFWYLFVDPQYTLNDETTLGGHMELRLRETDTFRTFVSDQVWTWELYGYLRNDHWGTLKAGQVFNQFGLFWDGVFFGSAAYFDGLKLDADYGLSWEKSTAVGDGLTIDSYLQFFFHEDQANGSFAGADAESLAGYTERNTAVARLAPTWTLDDGAQITLGVSAMAGEIESDIALDDESVWAYGGDLTCAAGPWKAYVEGSQLFGVRHPVNYISGGPSDRLSNFLTGLQFTHGAVTYRCSYSNSIYANPDAVQNLLLAGVTVALTEQVDFYLEWLHMRVDGAELPGRNGFLFNGLEWVVNWRF